MVLRHVDSAVPLQLIDGTDATYQPPHVYASEYYQREFVRFNERLGGEGIEFRSFIPGLASRAAAEARYRTHAMVSLPVLNPTTAINTGFDSFTLMDRHNDMRAMLQKMKFDEDRPSFYLLNVGETHYPYALPIRACRCLAAD